MKNLKALLVLIIFTSTNLTPPYGWAQGLNSKSKAVLITAVGLMPQPGSAVSLSAGFNLAHFKGMVIDPNDPFKFDFIIHQGDEQLDSNQKQSEYTKLIKYFLAALAVPDTDQWVNLSPYEKNRIIALDFGKTAMGRDLLAQDYFLKQLSSSLTNPKTMLGQKFWDQVYERTFQEFGTRNIPLNTFHKVWIVPDKAVIYEKGNMVYVIESHLKVMTEEDYLARKKHQQIQGMGDKAEAVNISNEVMRQIIIPAIEKEVNEGKNFAPLRQVFSGMLLATWYKRALKESILTKLYANKSKLKGIDQDTKNNEKIYQEYLKAYKKGVYNMIREDTDPVTQEVIPRKYFSGGVLQGYGLNWEKTVRRGPERDYRKDLAQEGPDIAMVTAKLVQPLAAAGFLTVSMLVAHGQSVTANLEFIRPTIGPVDSFLVKWGTNPDPNTWTNSLSITTTNATIPGLSTNTVYYFVVETIGGGTNSLPSNEVAVADQTYNWTGGQGILQLPGFTPGGLVTVSNSAPSLFSNVTVNNITGKISFSAANQSGDGIINATYNGITYSFSVEDNAVPIVKITKFTPVIQGSTNNMVFQAIATNVSPNVPHHIYIQSASTPNGPWLPFGEGDLNGTSETTISIPQNNTLKQQTNPLNQQFFRAVGASPAPGTALIQNPTKSDNTRNLAATLPYPDKTVAYHFDKDMNANEQNSGSAKKRSNTSDVAMKGGIDFASSGLDLQIKRDGKGVPLPVSLQNLDNIHIDGLVPVILDIKSAQNIALFENIETKSS